MPSIFISHTHSDAEIAHALSGLSQAVFGEDISVVYSTAKEDAGGIDTGEDWYRWIFEAVRTCDYAFVVLTPSSVQKPWILYEAGLIMGVAAATEGGAARVKPLNFRLSSGDLPDPMRRIQSAAGDKQGDMVALMNTLLDDMFERQAIDMVRFRTGSQKLLDAVRDYEGRVVKALDRVPMMVTEAAVAEWLNRLDDYENRSSEIAQLERWIKIAFGRNDERQERPLDLRIHRRLGELYARAGTESARQDAIRQFRLARQLAPRDAFVLRRLATALIDAEEADRADEVIGFIRSLDSDAFARDVESAALLGKFRRRCQRDYRGAAEVYEEALKHNPHSYYLANLAAEARLEDRDKEAALRMYRRAADIITELTDCNIWVEATAMNAAIALDEAEEAERRALNICASAPSGQQVDAIIGGLGVIRRHIDPAPAALGKAETVLRKLEEENADA